MLTNRRVLGTVAALAASGLVLVAGWSAGAQEPAGAPPDRGLYEVHGANDVTARTNVAHSGVDVLGHRPGTIEIIANPRQADALRAQGLTLELTGDVEKLLAARSARGASVNDFPGGDENYHTYDETVAELQSAAADHAAITALSSIGKSFEGRDLPIIKISDNAATDEAEPEVLFSCNMHAREHLTAEMCLHIVQRFTDGYGSDQTVTGFVDSKEIYVIPMQNPDGVEFDIASGDYQGWRKNRQPNSGGTVGTDINRNFSYKWGCCGGSSNSPSAEDYRGPSAASTPEVAAVQGFVDSRVVGGTQQIKAHIDFHTFSELVLWPFGWTNDDVVDGMTQEEYDRFVQVGQEMAGSNGYTPEQSSDLYITDGDITDYMWGQHKIFSFTFEMYPSSGGIDGFYPPDEVIPDQTARNDGAVDILLTNAT